MNFISTRNAAEAVSSAEAILTGLSSDGGLFVPTAFPSINVLDYLPLSYEALAAKVLALFLTDYDASFLATATQTAYAPERFSQKAGYTKKVADGLYALELWHGPTCAFKDYALQLMPHLLVQAKQMLHKTDITKILVATSGDTGKAALAGYADIKGVHVTVFYPEAGTSELQRLQMVTQQGENVDVYAVKGNFDDAQTGVKKVFTNSDLAREFKCKGETLSSANSMNWGRLVPQIVYYIYSYCALVNSGEIAIGEKIDFCVPTGNFGDILAGYYAKQMGLPIGKLICASNKNNVLTDFIRTGHYDARREFYKTTSPSMDILVSSNLERLLYHLSGDTAAVSNWMRELNETGHYTVSAAVLQALQESFACDYATDAEVNEEIKHQYEAHHYLCDTHTAVAFLAAARTKRQARACVVVSTANPYKFPIAVLSALGASVNGDDFAALQALEKLTGLSAPSSLSALSSLPVRFTKSIAPQEIAAAALCQI